MTDGLVLVEQVLLVEIGAMDKDDHPVIFKGLPKKENKLF
jgi:hypothetical protein